MPEMAGTSGRSPSEAAEVDIPNSDGALTPGIYCTIELQIPRKTPSYKISADAIIFNKSGLQVAVVENGVVRLRKVTVIRDFGKEVEVSNMLRQFLREWLDYIKDCRHPAFVMSKDSAFGQRIRHYQKPIIREGF